MRIAFAPATSAIRALPAAIRRASSFTSVIGISPPVAVRSSCSGVAPSRSASRRGAFFGRQATTSTMPERVELAQRARPRAGILGRGARHALEQPEGIRDRGRLRIAEAGLRDADEDGTLVVFHARPPAELALRNESLAMLGPPRLP